MTGTMARHPQAVWALCASGVALCLAAGCNMNPRPQDPDFHDGKGPPSGNIGGTGGATFNAGGGSSQIISQGGANDQGGTPGLSTGTGASPTSNPGAGGATVPIGG